MSGESPARVQSLTHEVSLPFYNVRKKVDTEVTRIFVSILYGDDLQFKKILMNVYFIRDCLHFKENTGYLISPIVTVKNDRLQLLYCIHSYSARRSEIPVRCKILHLELTLTTRGHKDVHFAN